MDANTQHTTVLPDRLLEARDVAKIINKPRGWVYDSVEAGSLPAIRVGRQLRFDPAEISEWLARRRVGAR